MSSTRAILITDLDNTLYDFAAYFSPSFRAMIHALAPKLSVDEGTLAAEFRVVFERHGTLEYQFVVQEIASVRDRPSAEIDRLVHAANVAFGRTRRRRLKLYPNVKALLAQAQQSGIRICAATNAPIYQAYRRLRDLGLLRYFSVVASRDGTSIPTELNDHLKKYEAALSNLERRMEHVSTHDARHLKPHQELLSSVVSFWGTNDVVYYSVGDSIGKDLLPSHKLGMTTIWARYGTRIAPRDLDTMLSVTPSSTLATLSDPGESTFKPDHIIDDFGELARILPIQLSLDVSGITSGSAGS